MPLSTPFSSAWRLDTELPPSLWPALLLIAALLLAMLAIQASALEGLWRVLLYLVLLLCFLRSWRQRCRVVHLRATPAVLRLTYADQTLVHVLPPWKAVVLPWMVAVSMPGRFGLKRWVYFYGGQFEAEDWRRLRVILRHAS